MLIGLCSRCLGCNSTFSAMTQFPEAFDGVQGLVAVQPVTTRVIVEHQLALAGVPAHRINDELMNDLNWRMTVATSIGLWQRNPVEWAKNVRVPTFLYQVHDDVLTDPSDVQAMFDNMPVGQKKLHWVRGTTRRWDGYLEFQRRPTAMLDWFDTVMAQDRGQGPGKVVFMQLEVALAFAVGRGRDGGWRRRCLRGRPGAGC